MKLIDHLLTSNLCLILEDLPITVINLAKKGAYFILHQLKQYNILYSILHSYIYDPPALCWRMYKLLIVLYYKLV